MPGLAEAFLRDRRFIPMAGFMGASPFELVPGMPDADFFPETDAHVARAERDSRELLPWDAELVPDPDDLRPFLFPSVHALVVDDAGIRFLSREAIPTLNPSTAVPIALAALVPAIRNAQLARDRALSVNSLKQIGLAFHNFHQLKDHFPADIRGKDGKPLLSWRVAILPLLEQGELFNQFRVDEPWDSTHNKLLIARMPNVFAIPGDDNAGPGHTFYRGFFGPGAMFDPKEPKGVGIADITDGTSNTILVSEAKEAVPWTKPESDLTFENDDQKPETMKANLDKLGGHANGGFNVLFCDGSVRFIRSSVSVVVLRALITRAAGEVISSDSF
jgi:prepilin-type processing-associated H-X9-DG protein